jgi:hypothetical protein
MKLFIQLYNDKFIESLCLVQDTSYHTTKGMVNKDIYKIHHEHKFTHYIFIDKLVDNEIFEFIKDFHGEAKMYVYHSDKPNEKLIEHLEKKAIHLTKESFDNAKKIPLMCRENISIDNTIQRTNNICVFLDNSLSIPQVLADVLYPNTRMPIRLFNHASFQHPQNLGFLSEEEKITELQNSSFCIIINGQDYIIESQKCGCRPISATEIGKLEDSSYAVLEANQETTYEEFLTKEIMI